MEAAGRVVAPLGPTLHSALCVAAYLGIDLSINQQPRVPQYASSKQWTQIFYPHRINVINNVHTIYQSHSWRLQRCY